MIEYHDRVIGRIVRKLDELGIRESTLVIYLGDNGTPSGVVSRFKGADLRGGKSKTIDAATHVPWICNWPGTIRPGGVQKDLVDASDLLPTTLEVAGIEPPPEFIIDGRSFLPQLKGQKGSPRDWAYFHYDPWGGRGPDPVSRWVRSHRWKLFDDGRLLDLELDPPEHHPVLEGSDNGEQAAAGHQLSSVFHLMRGV